MKIIITEKQSLFLKRRLDEIEKYVKLALKRVPTEGYSYHEYVEEIVWQVIDEYGDKIGGDDMNDMGDYIRENYWKLIETYYLGNQYRN